MLASFAAFFRMWASSTNILGWGADQSLNMGHSGSSQISIDLHIILHPLLHHPFTNICILTSKFMLENIYYWPHHHRSASTLPVHKVVTLNAREGSSKVKVICLEKRFDFCAVLLLMIIVVNCKLGVAPWPKSQVGCGLLRSGFLGSILSSSWFTLSM